MKIGFETIIWGHRLNDLPNALSILQHFGFRGVEFFQSPEHLPPAKELLHLLREHGLELVGLIGGSVEERIRYAGDVLHPRYLYTQAYREQEALLAEGAGIPLALHPHAFARVRTLKAALDELAAHPQLLLLPDTGHLSIVGVDPLDAIRKGWDRLAAVHLKDWSPVYGTSIHRYAKGFTELGRGKLERTLDAVIRELRLRDYTGWIIVEQDNTTSSPERSIEISAQWLQQEGRELLPHVEPLPPQRVTLPIPPPACPQRDPEEAAFLRSLMQLCTNSQPDLFYNHVVEAFASIVPCEAVTLWACSPAYDTLSHAASFPPELNLVGDSTIDRTRAVISEVLARKEPAEFDLAISASSGEIEGAGLSVPFANAMAHLGATRVCVAPIFNSYNPNQVRFVLIFAPQPDVSIAPGCLARLTRDIALAADAALDERCSYAAASVSLLQGAAQNSRELLNGLALEICNLTASQGCSIFLLSETGDRLECQGSTGIQWRTGPEERYYAKGQGLIGTSWETEQPIIVPNARIAREWTGRSLETVADRHRDTCLIVPVKARRNGTGSEVVAVIRCRNKQRAHSDPNYLYTDDDVAVVDSIAQACFPQLLELIKEERRAAAMLRLTHEMRTPLVAVNGALDSMVIDLEKEFRKPAGQVFGEDYLGDARSWIALMVRLLNNADLASGRDVPLVPNTVPTLLLKDVIAATVRQIERLRRRRKLRGRIEHNSFEAIPRLYVDRSLMQQALFNLLSNAVKYAFEDPDAFHVQIHGEKAPGGFEIKVRDWGSGIEPSVTDKIFELGVRGRDRTGRNIAGQGIGLWVVRRAIEAHGGSVRVSGSSQPTEFTIWLPAELALGPPSQPRRSTI